MATIDTKVMLDDVRARDVALFSAIAASDRQSVALFRIYVTMILALTSGIVAVWSNTGIPAQLPLVLGGIIGVVGLAFGCWFCFRAIKTAEIAPPGRGAEFWQWALRHDVTDAYMIESYLKQSLEAQDINHVVNQRSATAMRSAKYVVMWGIGLGILVAFLGATGVTDAVGVYLRSLGLFGDLAAEAVVTTVPAFAVDFALPDQVN